MNNVGLKWFSLCGIDSLPIRPTYWNNW